MGSKIVSGFPSLGFEDPLTEFRRGTAPLCVIRVVGPLSASEQVS